MCGAGINATEEAWWSLVLKNVAVVLDWGWKTSATMFQCTALAGKGRDGNAGSGGQCWCLCPRTAFWFAEERSYAKSAASASKLSVIKSCRIC